MKIAYLIVLISYALCSTDRVFDISFNTEYTVDIRQFDEGYIPGGHSYYFRMPSITEDELKIQLKVYHNADASFKVDVCGYKFKPTDTQVINGNQYCGSALEHTKSTGSTYDEYIYPFETDANVEYLAIHVFNYNALDFLSVYIYSHKGMALAVLLLIILLPIIIVGAVVIFILNRLGCIRVRVTSNTI